MKRGKVIKGLLASFVACVGLLTVSSVVRADDIRHNEVTGSANYFHATGSGVGTFGADASYGYYFNPMIEAGVRQSWDLAERKDARDTWTATTAPFVDFNFTDWNQSIVPFAGGFIGGVWNDEDGTGIIGPEGGLKFYFNDSTFLLARYRYEWFFDKLNQVDDTTNSHNVVNVGLGYRW